MPDNFIDLTVTSPPYDKLRDYKGYSFDFESIAKELYRVAKEGGVVVWVVNDSTVDGSETLTSCKQKIFFREVCGFNIHDTMIYRKSNPPPNAGVRYNQEFEYKFVISKGKPKTFNPLKVVCKSFGRVDKKYRGQRKENGNVYKVKAVKEEKIIGNIWEYDNANYGDFLDHPAPFPEGLAEDHIRSWSNENDMVYDCFSGSGATAKMAIRFKRNFIGSEISEEYCDIANKRIQQELSQLTLTL
jgi:DNA modification methylase